MAGFQVRRHGFKTAGAVILSVIDDMLANGFTFCGTGAYSRPLGAATEKFTATLEAGPTVDPLNPLPAGGAANQAWRINFTVYDNATCGIVVGPDGQLPNGGALPTITNEKAPVGDSTSFGGFVGVVGKRYTRMGETEASADVWKFTLPTDIRPSKYMTQGFINRAPRVWVGIAQDPTNSGAWVQPVDQTKDLSSTYPLSYYLAITPRGFYLTVWEGAASDTDGDYFSWVLVQRPVDRDTGATIVAGKAPVFCVNSVGGEISRFVVRESDILRATMPASAVKDEIDTAAIINDKIQVAVSEDNQYVVSFPSRLNTTRYAYTYELDMIGYTSATVVSQNTEVPLTLYGEAVPRNYVAIHANEKNSNGMRIVALTKGGGITA